ncbi:MAG: hypothetical protein KBA26_07700 [Candidatus Delongbacteria bacterium]|nr:hypothetical protein [Candidatus Delongbacteria bacterium]
MSIMDHIVYSDKNLKGFCRLWAGVLLLCTAVSAWRGGTWWPYLGLAALVFLGLSFWGTGLVKPLYMIWMMLANALSFVTINLLLSLFFYLVITPIGIIFRLSGKSFFPLRPDSSQSTYWIPRDPAAYKREHMEKQFS